jgi:predicted protein tyrosine phosphatase
MMRVLGSCSRYSMTSLAAMSALFPRLNAQGAALAHEADAALDRQLGSERRIEADLGVGVDDAHAVGPHHDHVVLADDLE